MNVFKSATLLAAVMAPAGCLRRLRACTLCTSLAGYTCAQVNLSRPNNFAISLPSHRSFSLQARTRQRRTRDGGSDRHCRVATSDCERLTANPTGSGWTGSVGRQPTS